MNKAVAVILTAIASMVCGCPGLFLCVFGILVAVGSLSTFHLQVNDFIQTGPLPQWVGYIAIAMALIFFLVPVVVGILTFRKKSEKIPPVKLSGNEHLPPPS